LFPKGLQIYLIIFKFKEKKTPGEDSIQAVWRCKWRQMGENA
jgi:hypothetical protein